MSNPLHNFYVRGADGVIYRAVYALENDYYLVCNTNLEATDLPLQAYVIKGQKVEDYQQ